MAQPQTYQEWLLRYNATEAAHTAPPVPQAMMVQTDFRAQSGTTALRRGFNGKKPRDRAVALSDCICTLANGDQYIMGAKKETYTKNTAPHKLTAADMPAIGDSNH